MVQIRKRTDYLVVHCSASGDTNLTVEQIRAMHKAQGWLDIGYNDVITRDGKLHTGRGRDAVGSHVKGFNSTTYGICLVGGKLEGGKWRANFSDAQYDTLEKRLRELQAHYPNKPGVLGHRDLSPDKDHSGVIEPREFIKECPTFNAREWAASKGLKTAPMGQAFIRVVADAQAFVGEEIASA